MDLQEKKKSLENQRDALKEAYIKTCGALEFVMSMIKEQEANEENKSKKKD